MAFKIVFILITCFVAKAICMPRMTQLTRFGRSSSDITSRHHNQHKPTFFSSLTLDNFKFNHRTVKEILQHLTLKENRQVKGIPNRNSFQSFARELLTSGQMNL